MTTYVLCVLRFPDIGLAAELCAHSVRHSVKLFAKSVDFSADLGASQQRPEATFPSAQAEDHLNG